MTAPARELDRDALDALPYADDGGPWGVFVWREGQRSLYKEVSSAHEGAVLLNARAEIPHDAAAVARNTPCPIGTKGLRARFDRRLLMYMATPPQVETLAQWVFHYGSRTPDDLG